MILLVPFALVPAALAAAPDAAAIPAMSGAWRLGDARPVVQARVDAAVEGLLAPLNLIVRGIARPRLTQAATFCDTYQTTLTTTGFSVSCDARPAASVPFDQPPLAGTSPDGRGYTVAAAWENGTVVLTFKGDAGAQVVRYRAESGALHVEKTLLVDQLDTKMSWPMRYVRP